MPLTTLPLQQTTNFTVINKNGEAGNRTTRQSKTIFRDSEAKWRPYGQVCSLDRNIKTFLDCISLLGSFYQLWRTDALKSGTTVGVDKYGNTYYENKRYFVGRSRWVVYNDNVSYDYDGSQVPAEWYGWLHYKTDLPPTIVS